MIRVAEIFGKLISGIWRGVTRLRVALANLLFLLVLVMVFVLLRGEAPEPLPEQAALLLNPVGTLVEQKSYVDPFSLLFDEQAPSEREVLLQDVIDSILLAKEDRKISALVLELELLFNVGLADAEAIAAAITEFRESGKPVVAWGDYFSQGQYLLAAQADTVILHPMGGVQIEGFGRYQWYLKEALDKLAVTAHVFRAGKYKSAAEPLMRSDMSPEEKEASQRWLDQLWSRYTSSIESRRSLEPGSLEHYIDNFPTLLSQQGGDAARTALESGLVDRLDNRGPANRYLVELVGAEDEEGRYEAVEFDRYLTRNRPIIDPVSSARPSVGVIVAQGNILDGDQPAGSIGGNTLARLLGQAAEDENIRAIVMRVDSGGGSAFASEVIRQKVLYAQSQGKPVVVSMGSMAASGGYWIAADADEIWASPSTLTGSIGVFGVFPTITGLLNKLGIQADGVGTTDLAGVGRSDLPLDPKAAAIFQAGVDGVYQRFLNLVAEGRDLPLEEVRALAGGRVWSGIDAHEMGLVDHLGDLDQAIDAAARLASLDAYEIELIEQSLSPRELFLSQLMGEASFPMLSGTIERALPEWLRRAWLPAKASLQFIYQMNDPAGYYARCETCSGF